MNAIRYWLETSDNFSQGIHLLRTYAPGHRVVQICDRLGATEIAREKLRAALRSIQDEADIQGEGKLVTIDAPIAENQRSGRDNIKIREPISRPARVREDSKQLYTDEIAGIIQEIARLANQRDRISNDLVKIKSKEGRARARKQIDELSETIYELRKQRQDIESGDGRTIKKEPTRELPDQVKGWRKKRDNARSNRAKKMKKLKEWRAKKDVDKFERQAKIKKYQDDFSRWNKVVKEYEEKIEQHSKKP